MDNRRDRIQLLLLVDGVVNLILGLVLLLSPSRLAHALDLPAIATGFYPSLLGAVLLGIGLALLVERYLCGFGARGLGLAGAVAINLCGGIALILWLVAGQLRVAARGLATLWAVAGVVLLLAVMEISQLLEGKGCVETARGEAPPPEAVRGGEESGAQSSLGVKLRDARPEDVDIVVSLIAAMLREMALRGSRPLRSKQEVRRHLEARTVGALSQEDHLCLLVTLDEDEGEVLGVCEASVVAPHAVFEPRAVLHIHAVYVLPQHRGRGIGRALLEAALAWGRARGCEEADLNVLADNPARILYERLSFTVAELEMRLDLQTVSRALVPDRGDPDDGMGPAARIS